MKPSVLLAFLTFLCWGWTQTNDPWRHRKYAEYDCYYQSVDRKNLKDYASLLEIGCDSVRHFFRSDFPRRFAVYIHPDRASLDLSWQKDWQMPDFKSECWMVASGVGAKLDLLSPKTWDKTACEHLYADKTETQRLIIHELTHVYHGQINPSPDFSEVEGLDWFVEGLATYASGQCDSKRMEAVKNALLRNEIPLELNRFWTGKHKYGLSGSLVQFIDIQYGREKLISLTPLQKKEDLLRSLHLTETELLTAWRKYMLSSSVLLK